MGIHNKGKIKALQSSHTTIDTNVIQSNMKKTQTLKQYINKKIAMILVATTLGGVATYQTIDHLNNQETSIENSTNISNKTISVNMAQFPKLKNKKITKHAPLTKMQLGYDTTNTDDLIIPDTLAFNPSLGLHYLRSKKIKKYTNSTIEALDTMDISQRSDQQIEDLRIRKPIEASYILRARPYITGEIEKKTVDIREFIGLTQNIINERNNHIQDYTGNLSEDKLPILTYFKNNIRAESLIAYFMTELCENKEDGELNVQLFDFMLQHGGVEYLGLIPAIYDAKTSYGIAQFTEFALYDVEKEQRGASIINKYIPSQSDKIPGSVIDLHTMSDQISAAYMFALYNVARSLALLDTIQTQKLSAYITTNPTQFIDNITQLIAMTHHLPEADKKALGKRIDNNFQNHVYTYGKAQTYGKKTMINHASLTAYNNNHTQ